MENRQVPAVMNEVMSMTRRPAWDDRDWGGKCLVPGACWQVSRKAVGVSLLGAMAPVEALERGAFQELKEWIHGPD